MGNEIPQQGRVALITGGGGGIGSVTAKLFAQSGYRVVVSDLNLATAQSVVDAITAAGGEAIAAKTDISDKEDVARLFALIREKYGRLHAAFNNAGVSVPRLPMLDATDEAWHKCINVNLTGTWYCMREELRLMLEHGGGAIVNNGSIFSMNAGPSTPYTASKHGIAGLTKSASLAYASQNVRVNAVCPGLIEAGMGNIVIQRASLDEQQKFDLFNALSAKRAGTALEVAQAVLWLCSDAASYIHGHLLPVDGGLNSR
jgi:NAD(P)-dependent dehydrogenase (short-subunit alcohol dehydrogenase family)